MGKANLTTGPAPAQRRSAQLRSSDQTQQQQNAADYINMPQNGSSLQMVQNQPLYPNAATSQGVAYPIKPPSQGGFMTKKMMAQMPNDLTGSQALQYQNTVQGQGQKAGADFLRNLGYQPRLLARERAAGTAPKANPNSALFNNYNNAPEAVASAESTAKDMANMNTQFNRPDQTGAFGGSKTWSQNPDGTWQSTTSLSAPQQQMLDQQNQYSLAARQGANQLEGTAISKLQQPYDYSGIAPVLGGQDLQTAANNAQNTAFQGQYNMMAPDLQLQQDQFQQMAAGRGWTPDSAAYQNGLRQLNNSQNTAVGQLASQSVGLGQQQFNNEYNASMGSRQQGINEYNQQREQPLMDASALANQGPGIQQDQFTDYGATPISDVNAIQAYGYQNLSNMQGAQDTWQGGQNQLDRANQLNVANWAYPSLGSQINAMSLWQNNLGQSGMTPQKGQG